VPATIGRLIVPVAVMAARPIHSDQEYLRVYRVRQRLRAYARFKPVAACERQLVGVLDGMLSAPLGRYEERVGDAGRVGSWIPTVSGRRLWLQDPRPAEVEPYDVAYGLARIPRYNAMTSGRPFTVAQHSVLTSFLVEPRFRLHALLHDAHEYVGMDVTSPLKRLLGDAYAGVEARLKEAVARRFGIEWTAEAAAAVKEADNRLLATEVAAVTPWGVVCGELPALPLGWPLRPLRERQAFETFAARLNGLLGYEAV
jgi:5'-deoxynucleotidase YfbR-like HD superfamily hydrolase